MSDAIEHNRQALLRILAMLVAMAGLDPARPQPIPRPLRNAVLRLLRPAESAARRLVVALAARLVVRLLPAPLAGPLRGRRHFEPLMPKEPALRGDRVVRRGLPLLDRLRPRRGMKRAGAAPRIGFFDRDFAEASRPVRRADPRRDAARLAERLAALRAALDDLPARARRLSLWLARQKARRAAGAKGRAAWRPVLRFGFPPGQNLRAGREIDKVVVACHDLATADTS